MERSSAGQRRAFRRRRVLGAWLGALFASCSPEPQGFRSGLTLVGDAPLRQGSPHLAQIVLGAGVAYVANSNDGVAAFRLEAGGSLRLVSHQQAGPGVPRCTTLALHPSSGTLFCSAADRLPGPFGGAPAQTVITAYDASRPEALAPRAAPALATNAEIAALLVQGDRLLIAAFGAGVLQAAIGSGGALDAPVPAVGGDAVALAGKGDLVAVLDRDAGVRVLHVAGSALTPLAPPQPLDGPLLGVALDDAGGPSVAVALGSRGVAVLDVSDGALQQRAAVQPGCSVQSVALRGALLVATCQSGMYLYDLGGTAPRVRGFAPARIGMLDAAFAGGDLLVASDWHRVLALRVDPTGDVVCADVQRSVVLGRGQAATVRLMNPGTRRLRFEVSLKLAASEAPLQPLELGPGQTGQVHVPADVVSAALAYAVAARVSFKATPHDEGVCGGAAALIALAAAATGAETPPALGDAFPPLAALQAVATGDVASLPIPARRQLILFDNPSCVALWPELRDLAWHLEAGGDLRGYLPVLITNDRDVRARWRLGALPTLARGDSYELGETRFRVGSIPGPWHTSYYVAADGTVAAVERVYRGIHDPLGGFAPP